MGKILLLEEIANEVLAQSEQEFTLFGNSDFYFQFNQGKSGPYDFIFHCVPGIPIAKFEQEPFLIIPFLTEKPDSKLSSARIYEINKQKSFIQTFGFRTNETYDVTYKGKKREEQGQFLRFHYIKECSLGKELPKKKTYFTVSEQDLKNNLVDWKQIFGYISEKKEEINKKYRTGI